MSLLNPAHALPDLGVGAMYSEVAEYTKAGNFLDFIRGNITLGQKASLYWAIGAGRFLQTAGLFLLGLYIGRKELFVTSETHLRFLGKGSYYCCNLFRSLVFLKRTDHGKRQCLDQANRRDSFRHVAEICVYIHPRFLVCTLIPEKNASRKAVSALRFYGKMSLTNYIAQSIMGAIIYFPVRTIFSSLLWLYNKFTNRVRPLPVTSFILQMVAGKPQTRSLGKHMA